MALLEDDDTVVTRPPTDGPSIYVWRRPDGTSTIELDLSDAEAQAILPAIQGYLHDLTGICASTPDFRYG